MFHSQRLNRVALMSRVFRIYAITWKNKAIAALFCGVTIPQFALGIYFILLGATYPGMAYFPPRIFYETLTNGCIYILVFVIGDLTFCITAYSDRTLVLIAHLQFLPNSDGLARHPAGFLQTLRVLKTPPCRDRVYLHLTLLR